MESPPDYALNPFPSQRCRTHDQAGEPAGPLRCYHDGAQADQTNFFTRPDLTDDLVVGGRNYTKLGVTPGFAAGYPLFPYMLDWGDCQAVMTRRRAHVTCLKGWPRREDRAHALALLARYVRKGDDCIPGITGYLIHATPFVGWTWSATALREWLDYVELDPACTRAGGALEVASAAAAATTWIARAAQRWPELTREAFPYTVRDLVQFFQT